MQFPGRIAEWRLTRPLQRSVGAPLFERHMSLAEKPRAGALGWFLQPFGLLSSLALTRHLLTKSSILAGNI